jgi:small subunit ribosomal protein S16
LAVRIRLQRHGKKKRPFYRLVAADSRSQRDGRFIERIGYYDPMTDPANIVIDAEKALKWLRTGAQPSDTAKDLMSKVGVWEQFMNEKLGQPSPTLETESTPTSEEASDAEEEPASAE